MGDPLTDDSNWTVVGTRFTPVLDILAAVAPDDPMVQEMLLSQQRIARKYEDAVASMPEGLTEQQRGEYIAAAMFGDIYGRGEP